MLHVHQITKSYGVETLLEEVSLVVNPGDRVGLVGPNGCGKSTLLRIIVGLEQADGGRVMVDSAASLGYLAQGMQPDQERSVGAEVRAGIEGLEEARREVERLAAQMSEGQGADQEKLLAAYGEALTRFENLGGYTVEHRVEEALTGLGLAGLDPQTPLAQLSGGQQTRVGLARLLISEPTLLLLDEPTNHLDIQALEWLEAFLSSYTGAALIVSHDRTFLDNTVNRILELDEKTHRIAEYTGSYSDYELVKAGETGKQWAEWKDQQAEIRRLKGDIQSTRQQAMSTERGTIDSSARRLAAKVAKKAKTRESRLRRYLDSQERVEKPEQTWKMKFDFGEMPRSGQMVAQIKDLGHGFDGGWLFQNIDLTLQHGERIALVGPNGCGKSTLVRILTGELEPKAGLARLGASVRLGYMPQKQESLDPQATPLSLISQMVSIRETEARNFLHHFLFTGDEVFIPIEKLSYGERARLLLARLVVAGANFLVLDEPINHLDIPSRERFQATLEAFPGTILAVVHDRAFIEAYASKVWRMAEGGVEVEHRE